MLPRVSQVPCEDVNYLVFSGVDYISNSLFRYGSWEKHLIQISQAFFQDVENPVLIDVGANLGAYSIPLAKYLDKLQGKVYGFEPQRIVYYQLCGNLILNRLDNYFAINSAVGDVAGFIDIPEVDYSSNVNIGAFSLEKEYRERHHIESSVSKESFCKVPLLRLDDYSFEGNVALVKIDVEGFELSVLKGGVEFLKLNKFPPILFEAWSFDWFDLQRKELLGFVLELGYEILKIGDSDYLAQHPEFNFFLDFVGDEAGGVKMVRREG